jgi:acetyl esterase/lipase
VENQDGSDFEEDGERLLDVQVALDWYLSQHGTGVDRTRIMVVGLEQGGRLAAFAAGLIPEIDLALVSGASPELRLVHLRGANHKCHEWFNGGFNRDATHPNVAQGQLGGIDSRLITEFIDLSDVQALIAPRPLIVQTGALDFSNSSGLPGGIAPFANEKHTALRARQAWGALTRNHLHTMFRPTSVTATRQLRFSAGLANAGATEGTPFGVPVFTEPVPGAAPMSWQSNGATVVPMGGAWSSVFDFVAACFAGSGCGHAHCCP